MDPYISFVPYRREEWKGHATKKAVRQAIAYDRGRGRLRLYEWIRGEMDVHAGGITVDDVYREVPRDRWSEMFTD